MYILFIIFGFCILAYVYFMRSIHHGLISLYIWYKRIMAKTNDLSSGMYIKWDGAQQIIMISSYALTKKFNTIMMNKTYRNHTYLGYAYTTLFSECIGTHYGNTWIKMKKPLDSFFSSGAMTTHHVLLDKCIDQWYNEKFGSKQMVEISLNELDIDVLTIKFLAIIVFGEATDKNLSDLSELILLHEKIVPLMGPSTGIRYGFKIGYEKELDLIRLLYTKWNCLIFDHIENPSGLLLHLVGNEIYVTDTRKLIHTLYETILFNVDIMINAMAMLIWDIGKNQMIQDKLRREICEGHETYLNCVVSESARLHPGVLNTFTDSIREEIEIDQHKFPAHTMFSFDVEKINKDPDVWTNPNVFNPDRFESDLSLFPKVYRFGLGPRKCIGRGPADRIIKKTILKILSTYKIRIIDDTICLGKNAILTNLANGSVSNVIQFIKD